MDRSTPGSTLDARARALKPQRTPSGAVDPPAFLCDGMLGHLARWLRLLGLDAEYAGSQRTDDEILAGLSGRRRFLVTRDAALQSRAQRRGVRSILVPEAPLEAELFHVLASANAPVEAHRWFTRCTNCNHELVAVEQRDVQDEVPEGVLQTPHAYHRCPACAQVYWDGTHVPPIRATLEAVARRLHESRTAPT